MTVKELREVANIENWYEVTTEAGIFNIYFKRQHSSPSFNYQYFDVNPDLSDEERTNSWRNTIEQGINHLTGLKAHDIYFDAIVDVLETVK